MNYIIGNTFRKAFNQKLIKMFSHNSVHKHSSSNTNVITAGIIIIGDEILNGQTEDINSAFLIKNLNEVGLKVSKVSILPDDADVIAKEVAELSEKCSVLLTSGGIGPTHDDVTYEAVAKAFGEDLKLNNELQSLFTDFYGEKMDDNPGVIKFASIPKSSSLKFGINKHGKRIKFPLVSVKNIYMLPGVPSLLKKGFEIFTSNFLPHNKPLYTVNIFITLDEFTITSVLNDIVKQFGERVKFGSYPTFDENYYKVKLVLESSEIDWINEAVVALRNALPENSIAEIKKDLLSESFDKIFYALCRENPPFQVSRSVIDEALNKYNLSDMSICFNGGKDCAAVLHLLYCCVHSTNPSNWLKMHTLYVKNGESFQEVEDFIKKAEKIYKLNLTIIEGDIKTAFTQFFHCHSHLKAVFMGTRRSDPGSQNLTHFSPTDQDWPSVVRVLPILDWSYGDVWKFLRSQQIPYCTLYDRGYTSLGPKSKTKPNPNLLIPSSGSFPKYKPAYMLTDPDEERNGRI